MMTNQPKPSGSQCFPKHYRLKTKADFESVFKRHLIVANFHLVIYARPNELGYPRLGLAVGKKFGNAVQRNRYKRTIREAFRLSRLELPQNYDFVVLPQMNRQKPPKAQETSAVSSPPLASVTEYQKSLIQLCQKLSQRDSS